MTIITFQAKADKLAAEDRVRDIRADCNRAQADLTKLEVCVVWRAVIE